MIYICIYIYIYIMTRISHLYYLIFYIILYLIFAKKPLRTQRTHGFFGSPKSVSSQPVRTGNPQDFSKPLLVDDLNGNFMGFNH